MSHLYLAGVPAGVIAPLLHWPGGDGDVAQVQDGRQHDEHLLLLFITEAQRHQSLESFPIQIWNNVSMGKACIAIGSKLG